MSFRIAELRRRHDARTHGARSVQALAEIPLLMFFLNVAGGNVIDDRVAEHVVHGFRLAHVPGPAADDHRHLGFIVVLPGVGVEPHLAPVGRQGVAELGEDLRRRVAAPEQVGHFVGVVQVVFPDAQDLLRVVHRRGVYDPLRVQEPVRPLHDGR